MASPTFAEVWTQIKAAIKIANDLKAQTSALQTNLDSHDQSIEGEFAGNSLVTNDTIRSSYGSSMISTRNMLDVHFQDLALVINSLQTSAIEQMDPAIGDLFKYFITNAQSLNSRNIAFGAVTPGVNIGTGSIYRLTTDRNSQAIESTSPGVKEFLCLNDSNTGTSFGEEAFQVKNRTAFRDDLDWANHRDIAFFNVKSPENGLGRNMGWERPGGTAGVPLVSGQTIPDWELATGTISDFTFTTTPATVIFQQSQTEKTGTAYSLKCANNFKIRQRLSITGTNADLFRPHFFLMHFNREVGLCDGTLTIRMGSASKSVVLAAQTGWNVLSLDLNQNLWYQNFKEADLDLEIELSGRTTGFLHLDYGIFDTMDFHEGLWYAIIGGATYFQFNDSFTFTDTIATEAIIQYWLNRFYRRHLPHNNAGAETITDP